ncbi:hypothetical protein [Oryzomonas rubra]|uniref:Uncharacterized protein n=1 Tax=Oryzomonas rubra TaxID=2509454 RepID=A0A5A9X7A5_9BACT|nr:hypothetical protein [Oryzomonas rubra]KAA0888079.1 hypothetical protein ET418_16905 [Oryzomonas rubra]
MNCIHKTLLGIAAVLMLVVGMRVWHETTHYQHLPRVMKNADGKPLTQQEVEEAFKANNQAKGGNNK